MTKEKVVLLGIAQVLLNESNPTFSTLNDLIEPFGYEIVEKKPKVKNQILVLANTEEQDDEIITLPQHITDEISTDRFLESRGLAGRKYILFRSAHKRTY
jgi:hypothetical protein